VHRPYLHKPDEVELLPGVGAALKAARDAGFHLHLFTNQSGVGRGWFTLDDVHACNQRMLDLLGLGPDLFHSICIAPEAPNQPSPYRKPSPRFILETIARTGLDPTRCWMIGDNPSDWRSGLDAGIAALAVTSDLLDEDAESRRLEWGVPRFPDLASALAGPLAQLGNLP
jgi:D-glycero-D-manno-heptose 1,7-bisphosphate phosphatase